MTDISGLLRSIQAMEELLNTNWAVDFSARLGREQVKKTIGEAVNEVRQELREAAQSQTAVHFEGSVSDLIADRAIAMLRKKAAGTLKPVINATGVIIHTNLGRAPIAAEALKTANVIAESYCTLEYSPEKGERGGRNSHIEPLIRDICGAEAALVVNNNAAAVLLALTSCASGKEVIVSAGELVEIGGSFRIPDILSFSGAAMSIVGCTNSARLDDYRNAITQNTAVLLKVHPSNYRIEGFTASISRRELAALAAERGLVFIEDLGSGLLCPLQIPFAHNEYSVRECIEAVAGNAASQYLVTFSGDKLLGGPQIGVIAGSKKLVDKMRSHQLYRALRVDKMTLAAFEATLRLYLTGRQQEIPVIKMIESEKSALQKKAQRLCRTLKQTVKETGADDITIEVVECNSVIGGGAFPTDLLPGYGVAISSLSISTVNLAAAFRMAETPIIPNVQNEQVILHVRTLLDGDERKINSSFAEILKPSYAGSSVRGVQDSASL